MVPVPRTSNLWLLPLLHNDVAPKLQMPMINFPAFDRSSNVYGFLENFNKFRVTNGKADQQMFLLLFTHLKGKAVEWHAAVVWKTPPNQWEQVFTCIGSCYVGGPPQLRVARLLSSLKLQQEAVGQ